MEIENMENSLKSYVAKSEQLELSYKILEEKKAQFGIENGQLVSDIVILETQMNNIKDSVKDMAEVQYKETGEKKWNQDFDKVELYSRTCNQLG